MYVLALTQIGNYLGALKSWLTWQETAHPDDELFYFIASLHALTVPQNAKDLYAGRRNLLAALIAMGLNPHRCTIFLQDQVPEHTELGWILMCIAPFGRLERMTTWKVRARADAVENCDPAQRGRHLTRLRDPAPAGPFRLSGSSGGRYFDVQVCMTADTVRHTFQWARTKPSTWSSPAILRSSSTAWSSASALSCRSTFCVRA